MNLGLSKTLLGLLVITVLIVTALGCSKTESSKLVPPTYYEDQALDQAREYVNQGYELLDSNLVDSAVATFNKIDQVIPNGLVSNYHLACANGRTGNIEQAFVHLERLIEAGYDTPDNLGYDTDLESLKDDPRWEGLIAQAKANFEASAASFKNGMPHYDNAPQTFADLEECEEWVKEQNARMRKNSMAWTSAQLTAARIDLAAQKLTYLAALKGDDADFNPDLERVREAAKLSSMYETWGGIADLVVAEVENLLKTSPADDVRSEALYKAGLAMAMKYSSEDDLRVGAYTEANKYLEQVSEGSEFYPAAQTLRLVNQLRSPNADKSALSEQFKSVAAEYASDNNAYRIISTQYGPGAVDMLWPIPIDLVDLDGKQINLTDYRGKVLLIDFWATWCGPCRAELPNVLNTYEQYHDQGFEIVSISLDYKDRKPLADFREWIAENGMTWRHAYDGEGWNTGLVKKYFVSGIPATFLVGPDGSLIAKGDELRGEKLGEQIKKALGSA